MKAAVAAPGGNKRRSNSEKGDARRRCEAVGDKAEADRESALRPSGLAPPHMARPDVDEEVERVMQPMSPVPVAPGQSDEGVAKVPRAFIPPLPS